MRNKYPCNLTWRTPMATNFNVSLIMHITSPDDAQFKTDYNLTYSNVSYDTMVKMQEAVSAALVGLGKAKAVETHSK